MSERLVDVLDSSGGVIDTYPITLDDSSETVDEAAYEPKALEAAAHSQLVPDSELRTLTARMKISRGAQMAPYGDAPPRPPNARRVWSKPSVNAHIFSGTKTECPAAVRTNSGN